MTIFDKLMLFFGNAALALTAASVAGDMPKWLIFVALAVGAGCTAVAPSIRSDKRVPTTMPATPPTP